MGEPLGFGAGKQDDLQQDGRGIGQPTCRVVAVLGMENRQVEFMLDQVMH